MRTISQALHQQTHVHEGARPLAHHGQQGVVSWAPKAQSKGNLLRICKLCEPWVSNPLLQGFQIDGGGLHGACVVWYNPCDMKDVSFEIYYYIFIV
jgi:hypothetical protein